MFLLCIHRINFSISYLIFVSITYRNIYMERQKTKIAARFMRRRLRNWLFPKVVAVYENWKFGDKLRTPLKDTQSIKHL